MLPRFLSTEMTLKSKSRPRSDSRFLTGLTSTSEPGRKALTPMSTARPPLMRSMTRPRTVVPMRYDFSTSSQTFIFSALSFERTT